MQKKKEDDELRANDSHRGKAGERSPTDND